MPADNFGHGWRLERFCERVPGLGFLPGPEWKALREWLEQVRHNPFGVPRQVLQLGQHAGQTADEEDRERPFPPAFRSLIGSRILCEFMVDPDARTVTCIGLHPIDP